MQKQKIRSAYDGTRVRVVVDCTDSPSLTIQEHSDGCDINNILNKFTNNQLKEHVEQHEDEYNDFVGFDYLTNLNKVKRFESIFESLPAKSKKRFDNEPSKFLDYVQEKGNIDDMKDGEIDNFPNKLDEVKSSTDTTVETTSPEGDKTV